MADPLCLIGATLDGTYRVDALVGEGGFGIVYRGFHLGFEQPIAIKCLKLPEEYSPATREAFLRKFREEGRLLFQLSQGTLGIVRSIAIGDVVSPNGIWTPYFVLEWLEGQALSSDLMQRRQRRMTGRTLGQMLGLMDMPAKALAYAHTQRVAHRDIKPGNVFILPEKPGQAPQLKVLDFGIAKVMEEGAIAGNARATRMGFSSFTPQYAAPEQFDPTLGATGPWSDVYSFALLCVEVMTDRMPVEGVDAPTLMKTVLCADARPTPRNRGALVPDAVEGVFARALALHPANRFADIGAFWDALCVVAKNAQPAAPPTPTGLPSLSPGAVTPSSVQAFTIQSQAASNPNMRCPTPSPMSAPTASAYFHEMPTIEQPLAVMPGAAQPVAPRPHAHYQPGPGNPMSEGINWAMWVPIGLFLIVVLVVVFSGVMCTTCVCVSL